MTFFQTITIAIVSYEYDRFMTSLKNSQPKKESGKYASLAFAPAPSICLAHQK